MFELLITLTTISWLDSMSAVPMALTPLSIIGNRKPAQWTLNDMYNRAS